MITYLLLACRFVSLRLSYVSLVVLACGCDRPPALPAPLLPKAEFLGSGDCGFSPDGNYFYGENQIRETADWKVVTEFKYTEYAATMWPQFSPDSKRLVLLNSGIADIYEVPSFNLLQRIPVPGAKGVCLTPDQQSLAGVCSDNNVKRWALKPTVEGDAASEENPAIQTVDTKLSMDHFDISSDGSHLALANGKALKVYRSQDLSEVANIKLSLLEYSNLNGMRISPDNRRVVLVTGDEAHVVPLDPNEPTLKLTTFPRFYNTTASFCDQEKAIAVMFFSKAVGNVCVQFFDSQTGQSRGATRVHIHPRSLISSRSSRSSLDGKWLVTNGAKRGLGDLEYRAWETAEISKHLSSEEFEKAAN